MWILDTVAHAHRRCLMMTPACQSSVVLTRDAHGSAELAAPPGTPSLVSHGQLLPAAVAEELNAWRGPWVVDGVVGSCITQVTQV